MPPTIRDLETELDAAENAGRRGWPVWPWLLVLCAGYLIWRKL